jgi:hypothetical protein
MKIGPGHPFPTYAMSLVVIGEHYARHWYEQDSVSDSFVCGLGFYAWAADFEAGTTLTATATIPKGER